MKEVIIYSPGAYKAYGHSFDYSKGLASALSQLDYIVYIYGIDGPLRYPSPIREVRFEALEDKPNHGSILQKISWGFKRISSSGNLLKKFVVFYGSFKEKPLVLFETFEYFSLATHIKKFSNNYFCIFHDTNFNFKQTSLVAGCYKYMARVPSKKIVKNSIKSFVHGEKMKANFVEQIGNSLEDKVEHIPYGAPLPLEINQNQKEISKRELGLEKDTYYLLSFGTLREDKEYLPIYTALQTIDNWRWIIAGPEGDLSYNSIKSSLKEFKIEHKVMMFPKFIRNEEQALFFTAADIVINLYKPFIRHESGTAQLARTFNVPVIVAGPPDLTSYVDEKEIGWVLKEENTLEKVLKSFEKMEPQDSNKIKENIKKLAAENSWPYVIKRILSFK